jgi:hypothetical protein
MLGRALGRFVIVAIMLVLEVFLTMVVYIALNLYSLNTFGYLVRLASAVLEGMRSMLVMVLPGQVNAAYATLFGELGPKAILLLLIGLLVAAVLRPLTRALGVK